MKTMKKEITVFTALFICAVLNFSAASVRADAVSTSTSKALIDWTSLTITGDITWGDKGSGSYAYAEDDTGYDYDELQEPEWVETSASASMGNSFGDAYTSDDYLYEEVYASASKTTTTQANANAYAYRWGYFTADSAGTVEISANYSLWQELLTDCVGEFPWTSGYAEAGLYLENSDTSEWDEDIAELEITVCGMETRDGTLTVAVWFNAGDGGYFDAGVYNDAEVQVPEPATICLLAIGSLAFIRQRRIY